MASGGSTTRAVRRTLRRTRRQRRRRWLAIAFVVAAISGAALTILALADLVSIRADLEGARRDIAGAASTDPVGLRSPAGRAALDRRLRDARAQLAAARARLDGSVPLRLAQALPGTAYQRRGLRQLITDADAATAAAIRLSRAATTFIDTDGRLSGRVPLEGLGSLERVMDSTASELRRVTRGRRGLWGPLGDARVEFDLIAGDAARRVQSTADVIGATRGIAGARGPRLCLVAGLNNAEMRDQGMPLSLAAVRFEGGGFDVVRTEPVTGLDVPAPVDVAVPEGTARLFGGLDLTTTWQSANASADTALTGRLLTALYERATGDRPDCVFAIDAPALATVLGVIGPVRVPNGPQLNEQNAVSYLLSDQYVGVRPGRQEQRREQVGEVATAVIRRLRSSDADVLAVGRRLGGAAAGRHVWAWSAYPDEQAAFETSGLSGSLLAGPPEMLARRAASTFHVSVQDATGTKTDFFVRPELHVDVTVTRQGTAIVRTRVVVRNDAPAGAQPSYALGPNTPATSRPGTYVGRVYHWAPATASAFDAVVDSGLLASQKPLSVEPGSAAEVAFEAVLPNVVGSDGGELRLTWIGQPRHVPIPITVTLHAPGWRVEGSESLTLVTKEPVRSLWRFSR